MLQPVNNFRLFDISFQFLLFALSFPIYLHVCVHKLCYLNINLATVVQPITAALKELFNLAELSCRTYLHLVGAVSACLIVDKGLTKNEKTSSNTYVILSLFLLI